MVGKKSNSRRRIDLWIIWGKLKNSYRKKDKGSTEVFSPGKHKSVQERHSTVCTTGSCSEHTLHVFFFYICVNFIKQREEKSYSCFIWVNLFFKKNS